mmetsp:Transcript_18075/g.39399  ORF Transcript_18075/g.39399 Transcript_18075/m.39399 type:complete len:95 (-) Transcript_18075:162-446(-)
MDITARLEAAKAPAARPRSPRRDSRGIAIPWLSSSFDSTRSSKDGSGDDERDVLLLVVVTDGRKNALVLDIATALHTTKLKIVVQSLMLPMLTL